MKVLESKFAKRFAKLCHDGYLRGWHERNGGNLSYRMLPEADSSKAHFVLDGEYSASIDGPHSHKR